MYYLLFFYRLPFIKAFYVFTDFNITNLFFLSIATTAFFYFFIYFVILLNKSALHALPRSNISTRAAFVPRAKLGILPEGFIL